MVVVVAVVADAVIVADAYQPVVPFDRRAFERLAYPVDLEVEDGPFRNHASYFRDDILLQRHSSGFAKWQQIGMHPGHS